MLAWHQWPVSLEPGILMRLHCALCSAITHYFHCHFVRNPGMVPDKTVLGKWGGQQGRWNQCWNSFESHPSPPCCLRPRNTWLPGQVCQVTNPAITACRGHQEVDGLTLCLLLTPALPFPQRCASPGDGSPWLCALQAAQSLLFYVDKSLKQKETGFSSATLIMLTVCI